MAAATGECGQREVDGKSARCYNLRPAQGSQLRWLLTFGDVGVVFLLSF